MQIKTLRFLLFPCLCVFGIPATALGFFDSVTDTCRKVVDSNGMSVRTKDIKNTPNFRNAKFFKGLCSNKKAPSGKSYCVKLFSGSQVHDMRQAVQIAKDYASRKNNDTITCHSSYWTCADNDDHILCSTANNSAHYEFVFDDITEKNDAEFKKGIANSYCKLFFGDKSTLENAHKKSETIDSNDALICVPQSVNAQNKNLIYNNCDKMGTTMEKSFGYYTEPNSYDCPISFGTQQCSSLINNLPEIDNSFKTLQLNLDYGTISWLAGYVQTRRPKTKKFRCELAAHTCKTGEIMNPNDDILTCYVDNNYRIDFRFDDLSETKEKWVKASEDAKKCINENGVFDGRRCQGITKESCNKLKNNGVTTRWDTELKACVLESANTVANIKRTGEIASTVGVATGIAVATVATGGGTTVVLLAVAGTAATAASEAITTKERSEVAKFTSELSRCSNRDCVRKQFIWFLDNAANYIDNLTSEQIDAIDKTLAKKLELLDMTDADDAALKEAFDKSQDKGIIERCASSTLKGTQCVFDSATVLFDFLPVSRLAVKAPAAISGFVAKAAKRLPKTGEMLVKLRTSSKAANKALKVVTKSNKARDVNSLSEE